jgi:hypothetical protein
MSCISLAFGTPKKARIGSKAGRRLSIDIDPRAMTSAMRSTNSVKRGSAIRRRPDEKAGGIARLGA